MSRRLLGLPLALTLMACGATPLAPKFVATQNLTESAVASSIASAEARDEQPVVVGLSSDGKTLHAFQLTGAVLWRVPVQARSAPLVVGSAVVMQEADGVVVRDLASGKVRVSLGAKRSLVGADGVGDTLLLTVDITDRDLGTHGEVILVSGSAVRWEKALSQPAGTPALVQGQAVVPWGTQHVSVLAGADGNELSRWNFQNMVVGHARVDGGKVYLGQHGLLQVDGKLPEHQAGALTLVGPLKRSLPGQPPLLRDGYAAVPPPEHAAHKIELVWRPGESGTGVDGDAAILRWYRVVFGMAAARDELAWARSFEHDLVGSSAQAGGAYLVDDHGTLRFVDVQGTTRLKVELGVPLRVATVRPGNFSVDANAVLEVASGSLHDQLLATAQLADDRMHPARAFAIQHLARTQQPSVTAELIALCTRTGQTALPAQQTACDELGKREGNADELLAALRQKASFLENTGAPPVGALARAAARMQLKQAVPLILLHIEDPHTAASDLPALFQALGTLEAQSAVPQLERFVRLHHAEPEGSDLAPALASALSVLGELRAGASRATLEQVARDELTVAPVRQKAMDALLVLNAPLPKKEAPRAEKAKSVKPVAEVQTDPRPYALDSEAVQKAFRPVQPALERCLADDPAQAKSLRIAMIVAGDGHVEGFVVTPTSLQGCADALVRTAQFPATRLARQHVHQTVYASAPNK